MKSVEKLRRASICVVVCWGAAVAPWGGGDGRVTLAAEGRPAAGVAAAATRPVNRLAKEKSPYLLQHAHNPVDWYPWGAEAFERAKRENKPIFLSVGYSTCHWCHVMERESFEDAEVAKLLNDAFVCVKVDREERPDVDRLYMDFVVATTGSGGWPLTVLLTPDRKPFFGGTYFPPTDQGGLPGMKTLVPKLRDAWARQRDKVVEAANQVTEAMRAEAATAGADPNASVERAAPRAAFDGLAKTYDAEHGGFGRAPKFPRPAALEFLLHVQHRQAADGDGRRAREMAVHTLRSMAAGGMRDHLGGGFHRYATDARWFLPHFEKMLYDQAQLASLYLDAYRVTGEAAFADVARETLEYVLRDLTGPDGQFYSAEDADSAADANAAEKSEGAFYVWRAADVEAALGKEAAAVAFNLRYGVEADGNVQADPRREFTGRNVLYEAMSVDEVSRRTKRDAADVGRSLGEARTRLLAARGKRPRPHLDDKALTAWNGLMISALARGGVVLREPRYTAAAARAAAFVERNLIDPKTGRLFRRWRDGAAGVDGFLADYASFAQGLIELYESTLDARWLKLAVAVTAKQDELFWDKTGGGGYFTSAADDPHLLVRAKDDADEAEPAGNSLAALNLLRLSQMLDDRAMRERARATFKAYAGRIAKAPTALPRMLTAFDFELDKPRQVVIAGAPGAPDTLAMLYEVHARYLPHKVVIGADGGPGQAYVAARVEFMKDVALVGGRATAYVCENFTCQLPTTDVKQLARLLEPKPPAGSGK